MGAVLCHSLGFRPSPYLLSHSLSYTVSTRFKTCWRKTIWNRPIIGDIWHGPSCTSWITGLMNGSLSIFCIRNSHLFYGGPLLLLRIRFTLHSAVIWEKRPQQQHKTNGMYVVGHRCMNCKSNGRMIEALSMFDPPATVGSRWWNNYAKADESSFHLTSLPLEW